MTDPLVSIVIPAYNLARYLGEAIDSVLGQDYPHIELVVIDDGSTDNTLDILKQYGQRFRWVSQANQGQVRTLIRGWGMAQGQILSFLSADDVLEPFAVASAVKALNAAPNVVLAYGDFDLIDENSRHIRTVRTPDYDYDRMLIQVECPPGPGAFFWRSGYETVGVWDDSLSTMLDYDYWLRLGLHGDFVRIPKVLAKYRIHPGSQTFAGYTEEKAFEPVLILSRIFDSGALPPRLNVRRSEAFANAHLVCAQLNLRAGRWHSGVLQLRRAYELRPSALFSSRALRIAANVAFNRIGHRILWFVRKYFSTHLFSPVKDDTQSHKNGI